MTWELTPELEARIIVALENGTGLRKFCEQDDVPSRSVILKWQRENPDFNTKCAHAREAAGDLSAEIQGEVIEHTLTGAVPPDVARVVLSGLQWRAAKLASKSYGDKVNLNHGGQDGGNPQVIRLTWEK